MIILLLFLLVIIINVSNACIDLRLTSKHLGTIDFVQIAIEEDTGILLSYYF